MWHLPARRGAPRGPQERLGRHQAHGRPLGRGHPPRRSFLREFVGDVPWIHVDIAGPSMANKAYGVFAKGGTGHGVLTYLQPDRRLRPARRRRAAAAAKLARADGRAPSPTST